MRRPPPLFEGDYSSVPDGRFTPIPELRDLYKQVGNLQSTVANLENQVNETLVVASETGTVPPMTNFVDNSDFTLSHYAYSFATDPTANYILAKWYARAQSDTGAYYINTATEESPKSVRSTGGSGTVVAYTSITSNVIAISSNTLQNGTPVTISGSSLSSSTVYYVRDATTTSIKLAASTGGTAVTITDQGTGGNLTTSFVATDGSRKVLWDKETATLATSGGYVVASPLNSRYVLQGNTIYVKMTLAHKPREFSFTSASVDTANNTFTSVGHELLNGTSVYFTSDGTLPSPLAASVGYHIVDKTDDTFKLSETEGGTAIDLTTAGASTFKMKTRLKPGLRAKISLWQNGNTSPSVTAGVFKGDKPTLTATKIGSHSGGSTTRDYILEVQLPSGRRFYSYTGSGSGSFTDGQNRASTTVATTEIDSDDYVNVSWDKIVGASRYSVYRRSDSGDWYLIGTVPSSINRVLDYGGGASVFTPPTFDSAQMEFQMADAIIENATDAVSSGELVPVELNSSIQFPTSITGFSDTGEQFITIEFLKDNDTETATDFVDIPKNSLLIDKVSASYVYGRWHPSSRDQSLTPDKVTPTASIPSGGGTDGTSTTPEGGGGGTTDGGIGNPACVHENTPILVWSDTGDHYWMPAKNIVLGDRLVAWDGEKLAPSKVRRITLGVSRMNYRIYADDNELVSSFSHRVIADMDDFPKGTNVGRLDKTIVTYRDGKVKVSEIEGIESFSGGMKVVTFKMQAGLENYVSAGMFSHNRKTEYEFEV